MNLRPSLSAALLLGLGACAAVPEPTAPSDAFLAQLTALCGRSFEGRVVSNDAADADFRSKRLVMTVASCGADEVRIPFAVGEDRSRTWVVTRTEKGLRLKHDHRHADGTPDELTNYGGDARAGGTAVRQAFPADAESQALFKRTGRSVSNANVWALDVRPGEFFAYELRRPERFFRVEFDLTKPVRP